jgi:hypothetical protein
MRGQIKARTSDITQSVSTGFMSKTTKADPNTDPVISEPDHLIVARLSGVFVPDYADIDGSYVIHADGQSSVETYSFLVRNVKGIEQVSTVQALISGQAGSKFLWDGHNPTTTVNVLTSAVADHTAGTAVVTLAAAVEDEALRAAVEAQDYKVLGIE